MKRGSETCIIKFLQPIPVSSIRFLIWRPTIKKGMQQLGGEKIVTTHPGLLTNPINIVVMAFALDLRAVMHCTSRVQLRVRDETRRGKVLQASFGERLESFFDSRLFVARKIFGGGEWEGGSRGEREAKRSEARRGETRRGEGRKEIKNRRGCV